MKTGNLIPKRMGTLSEYWQWFLGFSICAKITGEGLNHG